MEVIATQAAVLVDTNVVSYWVNKAEIGYRYTHLVAGREVQVAFVTIGELLYGATKAGWGMRRRRGLETVIRRVSIAPFALGTARIYARISDERRRAGKRMEWADAWIAATALWYRMPLVTHDADFDGIDGLNIITLRNGWRVEEPRLPYGQCDGVLTGMRHSWESSDRSRATSA